MESQEKKQNERKAKTEEKMVKDFQNTMKAINPKIQELSIRQESK